MEKHNTIKIKDTIYDKSCIFYDRSEIIGSQLGKHIIIGNDSIVQKSKLEGNNSINRRNFINDCSIGKFSYTGLNTSIRSSSIGRFCCISWNVSIGGREHPKDKIANSTLSRFYMLDSLNWNDNSKNISAKESKKQEPCIIGNDVLISSSVIILRGVRIGDGAVIGAGAVITKNVEPYSVVVGVPAKKVKMRFNNKTIEALEKIQWWNWPTDLIKAHKDLIYSQKVDETVITQLKEISDSLK